MPNEEIMSGMLQWEPGSLTRAQLDTLLMDALSDLWQDCYRRGAGDQQRAEMFASRLEARVADATGQPSTVKLPYAERGR